MRCSLAELAARCGGEIVGDGRTIIAGVRGLEEAGADDLSLLTQSSYRERARSSRAAALLVASDLLSSAGDLEGWARPLWIAETPATVLARLLSLFHPPQQPRPGIHATAVIGERCEIDETAQLGPYAVIGDGTRIDREAVIGAHVVIGRCCRVAAAAVLHPHVVLYDRTEIGERAVIHAGTVLGADGFGYATEGARHLKVPQVGQTTIEADVEIGALSAVDRATLETTRIGAGSKIDNLVQVGHNVDIGRGSILCGQSGIAGSSRLGDYVVLAGQAGVGGHLEVGSGTQVAAKSALLQSAAAGQKLGGIPAVPLRQWQRQGVLLGRLAEILRRLRNVEKKLE